MSSTPAISAPAETRWVRLGNFWSDFKQSPVAVAALIVIVSVVLMVVLAPLVAPQDPYNQQTLDLFDARLEPGEVGSGGYVHWLGTDAAGRDVFSAILYGSCVSLLVGFASVLFSIAIGVTLGLMAGYLGGRVDALIMRIADIQLSFPAILIALLVFGVARGLIKPQYHEQAAIVVLIVAIGLSNWASYARTVRGSTLVERNKDYVQAARLIGIRPFAIMFRHVMPNVMGPVMVIGTINLALAIITEATLSFLGVGMPPTSPSLGTMINIGYNFLFSGEWWIVAFPGLTLALLVLAVNLLGDWLRDALNPRLR